MKIKDLDALDDVLLKITKTNYWDEYVRSGVLLVKNSNVNHDHVIVNVPKDRDRTPTDTPKDIHDYINNITKKKFGYNVRNGMFAFNNTTPYKFYGKHQYVLFPIDNSYRVFTNPKIWDFTVEFQKNENDPYEFADEYVSGIQDVPIATKPINKKSETEHMIFGNWVLIKLELFREIEHKLITQHTGRKENITITM